MKTNLDSIFKTSKDIEQSGVWFMVSDEIGFLVKRFGGSNMSQMKQAMAKYYKPFSKQIELGQLSTDKELELTAKAFVEVALLDWRGVKIDGVVTAFSREVAVNFLVSLPELFNVLMQYATNIENYREDVGN